VVSHWKFGVEQQGVRCERICVVLTAIEDISEKKILCDLKKIISMNKLQ
jgi:hypothetical protein